MAITPKGSPPTQPLLTDEEIEQRANAAIANAKADGHRSAYLDLGLDFRTTGRDGGPLVQRTLGLLAAAGYTDASLDGRSSQVEIPL